MSIVSSVCCLNERFVAYRRIETRKIVIFDLHKQQSQEFTIEGLGDSLCVLPAADRLDGKLSLLVYGRYVDNPEIVIIDQGLMKRHPGVVNCISALFIGGEKAFYLLQDKKGLTTIYSKDNKIVKEIKGTLSHKISGSGLFLTYKSTFGVHKVLLTIDGDGTSDNNWNEEMIDIDKKNVRSVVDTANGIEFLMWDDHIYDDMGKDLLCLRLRENRMIGGIVKRLKSVGYIAETYDQKTLTDARLTKFDLQGNIIAETDKLLDNAPISADIVVQASDYGESIIYATSFGVFLLEHNEGEDVIKMAQKINLE